MIKSNQKLYRNSGRLFVALCQCEETGKAPILSLEGWTDCKVGELMSVCNRCRCNHWYRLPDNDYYNYLPDRNKEATVVSTPNLRPTESA